MQIRAERVGDEAAIRTLTAAAFAAMPYSRGTEPAIVDALRRDGDLTLSLLAAADGAIVGHVAFSPLTIADVDDGWFGVGPLSVAPARQRQGIGSALLRAGLEQLEAMGARGCLLVGDPAYYRRFGFASDGRLTLAELDPNLLQWLAFGAPPPPGRVAFAPGFAAA